MRLILNCFKTFAIRKLCTALPEPPLKYFPTPRVGLELGVTNCRVAVHKDRETKVIKNGSETYAIPSVVALVEDGFVVGDAAIRHKNSENVFFMMELLIGKKFNDPIVQIISLAVCGLELGILSISILRRQNGLFEVKFTSNINLIDNKAFKHFPHFKKPNGHLNESHIDEIMCSYAKALIDAEIDKKEINDVMVIGTLAADHNHQFRQRMTDTMFGRKPLIAKAEDISIGAAMHCEVFALRFPSKYYDAEEFMKEAKANIELKVPDTVSSCEHVWKAVQDTIRLLYAKMGIWVYKHHSSKHLLFYASTYAPTVKDQIVIRFGFDASQTSHHYGYNSGLPAYVIKNYFVTINALLAEIRSLDHNEVRKGLEGFLKDVDRNRARKIKESDLNIPKLEVLIEDLNRSIIGEVKKEEQKELGDLNQGVEVKNKGKDKKNKDKDLFKLVKIPQFHQIINGDVYKLSYAAI
ncbi:unnamed protein product [Meloidogyne enterolobii]|uniref:Uncharacterized protein n=1 Tax=Meloidogyne enterolobii TaxID=390850 RepID=A0ACB0XZ92_MELEN